MNVYVYVCVRVRVRVFVCIRERKIIEQGKIETNKDL